METEKKKQKQKEAEDNMLLEIQTMLDGVAQEQNLDDEKQRFKDSLEHLQLQYKLNLKLLQDIQEQKTLFESGKTDFNEAYKKVNGIVTGITNAITNAQNCRIKVQLNDEAQQQLQQRNAEVVNALTTSQMKFKSDVECMLAKQRRDVKKITSDDYEGVYMTFKTFICFFIIFVITEGILFCQLVMYIGNKISSLYAG